MPNVKEREVISGFTKIARKKEKLEIAKIMVNNNEPIDKIVKYTGLTKQEIQKL